jgi:hypothetical protein
VVAAQAPGLWRRRRLQLRREPEPDRAAHCRS